MDVSTSGRCAPALASRSGARALFSLSQKHRASRRQHPALPNAAMGIGFHEPGAPGAADAGPSAKPDYGLSVKQMEVLGLTGAAPAAFMGAAPDAASLSARAFYVGDQPVTATTRQATRMAVDTKAPGQAPPDLPSLLLDGRICYIGMPLVPSVTELIISELLWLNYAAPEKPVYLYLNSTGSQTAQGEAVAFETEATAILDTLAYIRPDIYTLVVGQAFGNAAMLLAAGKKGHRFALPHARIMTAPPRTNRAFGTATNMMIRANELEASTQTYVHFMAKFTGRDEETVRRDVGRNRYFTPEQAIEYGIIDRVVSPADEVAIERRDYEAMLRGSQAAAARGGRGGGGAAAADA
jgi:ATP-dependent Clp protease protease subunit